jgi:hypothetical protein
MLDTLIRRELKVGDPSDPAAVAKALMQRYQDVPRAQAIEGEARGMPFLLAPISRSPGMAVQGATDNDLEIARTAVRADLERLLTDNLSADMRPELEGWQQALLPAIDEGVANARIGLDPFRRDVAFGARRQLGEYARLARLIGQTFPPLGMAFRRLATSLDDVANVLLVLMGEAMADVGFSGGRFLLQVNYGELQARRDAVLQALRRIDGIGIFGNGGDTWPRGLRAHRQLAALLEAQGQGDLRALLSETEMARTLDTLVQQAGGNSPRSLRAIGATAWGPLTRLRRFLQASLGQTSPVSQELTGLQEALQLFIEGFSPAAGFRLLAVARPAVLNGGARGNSVEDRPARRLVALVSERNLLAEVAEGFLDCRCDMQDVRQAQSVLDRVLFDLDRAIDHYCNGITSLGLPETRASALAFFIDAITEDEYALKNNLLKRWWDVLNPPGWLTPFRSDAALLAMLQRIADLLRPPADTTSAYWAAGEMTAYDTRLFDNLQVGGSDQPMPRYGNLLRAEFIGARLAELDWLPLVSQMSATGLAVDELLGPGAALQRLARRLDDALGEISATSSGSVEIGQLPEQLEVSLENIVKKL